MRFKSRIAALSLVMAAMFTVTTGAIAVTGTPAIAASCSGATCIGKDPKSTGCQTGATAKETVYVATGAGTISYNLVYSPSCHAYWALFISNYTIATATTKIIVEKQCFNDGYYSCGTYSKIGPISSIDRVWTAMVASLSSTERFRACDIDDTQCTAWYPN